MGKLEPKPRNAALLYADALYADDSFDVSVAKGTRQAKSQNVVPKLYSFTVGVPSADFRQALGKDAEDASGTTAFGPTGQISMPQTMVQIQGGEVAPIYSGIGAGLAGPPAASTARSRRSTRTSARH